MISSFFREKFFPLFPCFLYPSDSKTGPIFTKTGTEVDSRSFQSVTFVVKVQNYFVTPL